MFRSAARLLAAIVLLGAWGLSSGDGPTLPFLSEAQAGGVSPLRGDPDLTRLPIFNQVVMRVRDNYFDPSRIEPQQMLVDALDYVEKQIPEVMVDGDVKSGEVKLTVNDGTAAFAIADVDTIFKMSLRLSQIMSFVQKHLHPDHDAEALRNIEYALANGMLSSLDPHSVVLKPEYFREMKLSTKGEFGGLGFIIQMREGVLTVVRVLKGTEAKPTPAFKAGIRPRDRILRIEDESTVNMDVSEAAERLRGKPGSYVRVTMERDGWEGPREMRLARAQIEIESVISRLLDDGVGYVRIKNFQGNTSRALHAAIAELRKKAGGELEGLVLDLRSNPGGLLDQAIQVSDTFLDEGSIVTTVGMNNQLKEVKKATDQKNALLEKDLPLAVLVNGSSASASEIVAGALKNLDRAVVIGGPTFGKGSVQVLYDLPDESALKLTIAQYLTAGDVSIQETGITPDVELVASRVDEDAVSAFAPIRTMREIDLERHLANPADIVPMGQPSETTARKEDPGEEALFRLRYMRDERPADELVDEEAIDDADPGEEFFEDFQIRFAKGLLVAAPHAKRSEVLAKMNAYVDRRVKEEEKRFEQAIRDLGVDWSVGQKPAEKPQLEVRFSPAPAQTLAPGEDVPLELTVTNTGKIPVHRLRAWTDSESNRLLDRREFLIGHLAPGESRSWTVPVDIPASISPRRDPVTLRLEDAFGTEYDPFFTEVSLGGLPKPRFAYSWQVIEEDGPGLGLPRAGQKMKLRIDVQNLGKGASTESTFASIKNKGSEKIFIEKGRHKIGELAPGAAAKATFELELKGGYEEETMPLQLVILDEDLEELTIEELEIPVLGEPPAFAPTAERMKAKDELLVRSAPRDDAPRLATLPAGAVLQAKGKLGSWVKVEWAEGRFGFIPAAGAQATQEKATQVADFSPGRVPPKIVFHAEEKEGGLVSLGERYGLRGSVEGPGLRDVYVFVNDQKVFFARAGDRPTLEFAAEFPLKEGINHVVVVARDDQELTSRRMISILRRNPEMARRQPAPPSPPAP